MNEFGKEIIVLLNLWLQNGQNKHLKIENWLIFFVLVEKEGKRKNPIIWT